MQASDQTRQVYEELLGPGANASHLDPEGSTVLHHFIRRVSNRIGSFDSLDTFLDSGEMPGLLPRAGADTHAKDRFGRRPYEPISIWLLGRYPYLRITLEEANLAFWHQALRISSLCSFQCCDCPHHVNKIQHEYGCSCRSCRGGLDRVFEFDTFEEEMAPALTRWDMDCAKSRGDTTTI